MLHSRIGSRRIRLRNIAQRHPRWQVTLAQTYTDPQARKQTLYPAAADYAILLSDARVKNTFTNVAQGFVVE